MIAASPAMLHAKPAATLPARSWLLYAYRCLLPPLRPTRPLNPRIRQQRGETHRSVTNSRSESSIEFVVRARCFGSDKRLQRLASRNQVTRSALSRTRGNTSVKVSGDKGALLPGWKNGGNMVVERARRVGIMCIPTTVASASVSALAAG